MRVAIECKSLLLQKALEVFLEPYLVSKKQAEIIIYDEQKDDKRSFYIGVDSNADLQKPFSKSQLLLALQKRIEKKELQKEHYQDFSLLEKRIKMLTREYEQKILETIKAFYG